MRRWRISAKLDRAMGLAVWWCVDYYKKLDTVGVLIGPFAITVAR